MEEGPLSPSTQIERSGYDADQEPSPVTPDFEHPTKSHLQSPPPLPHLPLIAAQPPSHAQTALLPPAPHQSAAETPPPLQHREIDAAASTQSLKYDVTPDEPTSARPVNAIAHEQPLHLPRPDTKLCDSSADLYGASYDAQRLRDKCEATGTLIELVDAMRRETAAEIDAQMHHSPRNTGQHGEILIGGQAKPEASPGHSSMDSKTSDGELDMHRHSSGSSSGDFVENPTAEDESSSDAAEGKEQDGDKQDNGEGLVPVADSLHGPDEYGRESVYSVYDFPIPISVRSSISSVADPSLPPLNKPEAHQDLEALLLSTSKLGKVCIVTPKAGPFDGHLVALFTVQALHPQHMNTTSLPPDTPLDNDTCRRHIQSLKTALGEWGTEAPRPTIWIVLNSMIMDEEQQPDGRRLQTWVQNINSETEQRIRGLQHMALPGAGKLAKGLKGAKPKRNRQEPWLDRLSKVWEEEEHADNAHASGHDNEDGNELELFPLSPMQQLHFRTSMNRNQKISSISGRGFRFTQSILLNLRSGTQLTDVEVAIESLTDRHSMLRARFRLTAEGWAQVIVPQSPTSSRFVHHNADNDAEILSLLDLAESSINVTNGPVFAAEYIRASNGRQLLFLVAHHLVVDLKSWRVMLHDLDELLRSGQHLCSRSIPFPNWIDHQIYEASQRSVQPILPFEIQPTDLDFWGMRDKPNCYGDADTLGFYLSPDLTYTLQTTCNAVFRTETADIILAALLLSFCKTFPERTAPAMWKQEHGRDRSHPEFNLEETVGWFTALCPLQCSVSSTHDFIQVLKMIKDTRRSIPRSGIPFFTSHFAAADGYKMIPVEIMFNCLESSRDIHRKGGILEPTAPPDKASTSLALSTGPYVGRIALFEVSVMMDGAGTNVEAMFNRHSKHEGRIMTWMGEFERLLLEAIGRLRVMQPELTLADTPLLKTTYDGLSKLTSDRLAKIGVENVSQVETVYPANPAQQDILIARGQNIDSFQVHSIYHLDTGGGGAADQSRLHSAWETIVAAHPALRSIFIDSISEKGLFDQVVFRKISPEMLFMDSDNPEQTLANLPSMNPIPSRPRHRLSICKGKGKTFVRIDASQAICDSVSIHKLMDQLQRAFAGQELHVDNSILPTYLCHVSSFDTSYSLTIWKHLLANCRPCHFPKLTIEPAESLQSTSFGLEITRSDVMQFCLQHKTEPAFLAQLAWALVLRVFLGTDRATFGYVMPGRDEVLIPRVQDAIGSFATILPCTVSVSEETTLGEALSSLAELSFTAKQHQIVTMPEIQDSLNLTGEDLFNTCLSYRDSKPLKASSDGVETSLITSARTSNCDVSLSSTFVNDWLHVNISFRHMTANQAHNLINTFEKAFYVILQSPPAMPISSVDLVTDRDYALLTVHDWESSQRNQSVDAHLHDVILKHTKTRPHATAICSWDGEITYREMSAYVKKLSTYLIDLGVEPGMTVPIVLEKNKWAPIIMLGVLQAGCCFLSLDYQDRAMVEAMIKQFDPPFILATNAAWKVVNSSLTVQPFLINDTFFADLQRRPEAAPSWEVTPNHGACVFFTPGRTRTGHSKSIFFSHASLATTFSVQGTALKISSKSRVLQLSAFTTDIALVETLGTLYHGGCICIPSAVERMQDLSGAVDRTRATWSYMTAVLARRLNPAKMPTLKTICFRTRSLDKDTYGPWLKGRHILLAYGAPDVCPLGVSIAEVSRSRQSTVIPPPIMGKFWVINPADPRKPVPVGAIGELGIDCPAITPHRYTPNQPQVAPDRVSDENRRPGHLRTGHRVRYLEDGNIEFLSSMRDEIVIGDSPVSVAEVEQRIRRAIGKGVDVCVEAVRTKDRVQILAAFLEYGETNFRGPSDFDEISDTMKERAFLAKKAAELALHNPRVGKAIPPEHIPSAFVPIKRFPISSSLKINKRRLQKMVSGLSCAQLLDLSSVPNPAEVQARHTKEKPLPLTQVEQVMRRMWATVLEIRPEDISVNDNLLGLGGNKHKACQLVVACRQAGLGVSILDLLKGASLTSICETITTEDIYMAANQSKAGHVRSASTGSVRAHGFDNKFVSGVLAPQLKVSPKDILDIADASPSQIRALEMALWAGRGHTQCLVLNFKGAIGVKRLEAACQALTDMHPVLRTGFAVHERRAYQVLLGSFKPGFQRYSCPAFRIDDVAGHVIAQDRELAFNLHEPATNFSLFDAGTQARLVIRLSAAQVDDSSVAALIQDLMALYNDMKTIPKRPDLFEHQRTYASHAAKSISFWTKQLKGASLTQVVGHARPYSPVQPSEIDFVEETIQVNQLDKHQLTLDLAVKAAWAMVLSKLSGQADVLFGEIVPARGVDRGENDTSSLLVGPLNNTIPVRVVFPASYRTPLDLMSSLRDQRNASRPHEATGVLELIQHCTKWPYWTRFSSVVRHRSQHQADSSATMNMGNTPFTHTLLPPSSVLHPDVLITSTGQKDPRNVNISLSFPRGRMARALAQDMLHFVISAVHHITSYDYLTEPSLPSSGMISQNVPQITLPPPEDRESPSNFGELLSPESRATLQSLITTVWTTVINPSALDVPARMIHKAAFYDLWGSLLPAAALAEALNKAIRLPNAQLQAQMPQLSSITLAPAEIITHPTMQSQFNLLSRRLREAGYVPAPAVAKKSLTFAGGFGTDEAPWTPTRVSFLKSDKSPWLAGGEKGDSSTSSGGGAMAWTRSLRKKSRDFTAGFMKHRRNQLSKDSTYSNPERGLETIKEKDDHSLQRRSVDSYRSGKQSSSATDYRRSMSSVPENTQPLHQGYTSPPVGIAELPPTEIQIKHAPSPLSGHANWHSHHQAQPQRVQEHHEVDAEASAIPRPLKTTRRTGPTPPDDDEDDDDEANNIRSSVLSASYFDAAAFANGKATSMTITPVTPTYSTISPRKSPRSPKFRRKAGEASPTASASNNNNNNNNNNSPVAWDSISPPARNPLRPNRSASSSTSGNNIITAPTFNPDDDDGDDGPGLPDVKGKGKEKKGSEDDGSTHPFLHADSDDNSQSPPPPREPSIPEDQPQPDLSKDDRSSFARAMSTLALPGGSRWRTSRLDISDGESPGLEEPEGNWAGKSVLEL